MTKRETQNRTGIFLRHSGFGIPSAFDIRHSRASRNAVVTFVRLTARRTLVRFLMKKLLVSAAIGALALSSAVADRPVADADRRPVVQEKVQADNADYEYVTVTGSNLKQKMRKRGIITDTRAGNMITIDQREMQRNGMGDLANQLSRYPGISISRGR